MSERIVGATRLWGISVSFGAVNSLISMPCVMSHASIDPAVRAARGLPEDLIRLCVGIEDPNDLIDDLEVALLQAGAIKSGQAGLIRTNPTYNPRAHGSVLNKAIEKLADRVGNARVEEEVADTEWMVSAPGKVILFGEHAVVHGVVSPVVFGTSGGFPLTREVFSRPLWQPPWTFGATRFLPAETTAS